MQPLFDKLQAVGWLNVTADYAIIYSQNKAQGRFSTMIMADKIIQLRKKNGWSQEELAEKMNVSRQAVSKWESAQSIPDLEKILRLSELFGVTTDYLLKDDHEEAEYTDTPEPTIPSAVPDFAQTKPLRRVTLAEANEYLALRERASKQIALGVVLCIVGAIFLILQTAVAELFLEYYASLQPDHIGVRVGTPMLGIIGLLIFIAAAVAIFITTGNKSAHFEFLETEVFETEYGVTGMVKERQAAFRDTYTRFNLIGVIMCILSPILLFFGITVSVVGLLFAVCAMLGVIAAAVYMFVRVGVVRSAMQILLQEGDYTPQKKHRSPVLEAVSAAYWLAATAVYLAWSFIGDAWDISWVVWVAAAVLFCGIAAVVEAIEKRR